MKIVTRRKKWHGKGIMTVSDAILRERTFAGMEF